MLSSVTKKRTSLGRNQAVPLALIDDHFEGISTAPYTVVVTDVWEWTDRDIRKLVEFLKQYKFKHLRRGWCKEGYAVVFSTIERAALFRMFYPGNTKPLVSPNVGRA